MEVNKKITGAKLVRLGRVAFVSLLVLMLAAACARSVTISEENAGDADGAAATQDAQVQMTLGALLDTATANAAAADAEPTETPVPDEPTETPDEAQETNFAETLTAAVGTVTATATGEFTPSETPTVDATAAPCYAHRYVYDETIPDGTRMDPGEKFQKVWRLQNVGQCDWVNGEYQLVFVSGSQMGGQSPLVQTFTVPADGYANFAVNLTAPTTPGTYRGYWVLETTSGDLIGWGPDADQAFWVEIIVRGATPTP